ncbi:MAG: hypothetical protein GMKNLPBB_00209 [Myxococcota bacterium]|nr:hypothetical protein [Myxococcota bacterium]
MSNRPDNIALVIIGNEILTGKVRDENAEFAIRWCRDNGVDTGRVDVIPDDVEIIAEAVARHKANHHWVITSGGVGPTHDDVTIEGVARAFGVGVVRHPALEELIQRHYRGRLNGAVMRLADIPEGAEIINQEEPLFAAPRIGNVFILPGVPALFQGRFLAAAKSFRGQPVLAWAIDLTLGEPEIADLLNRTVAAFPGVDFGSYPRFAASGYKTRITIEGRDHARVLQARDAFSAGLPDGVILSSGEIQ